MLSCPFIDEGSEILQEVSKLQTGKSGSQDKVAVKLALKKSVCLTGSQDNECPLSRGSISVEGREKEAVGFPNRKACVLFPALPLGA